MYICTYNSTTLMHISRRLPQSSPVLFSRYWNIIVIFVCVTDGT